MLASHLCTRPPSGNGHSSSRRRERAPPRCSRSRNIILHILSHTFSVHERLTRTPRTALYPKAHNNHRIDIAASTATAPGIIASPTALTKPPTGLFMSSPNAPVNSYPHPWTHSVRYFDQAMFLSYPKQMDLSPFIPLLKTCLTSPYPTSGCANLSKGRLCS